MTSIDTPETDYTPASVQSTPKSKDVGGIITIVAVSIVVILAVIISSIFLIIKANDKPTAQPSSQPTSSTPTAFTVHEEGGISLGKELKAGTKNEGVPQVDIYFDYSCSHCNHLGNEYDAQLAEAAKKGDITLVYHPVAIMGTLFSYTGAAAEFFVAENEPDKYLKFHELVHEKIMTPYMNGELQDPRAKDIVAIAKEAGVSEKNCEALSKELTEMEDVLLNGTPEDATPPLTTVIDNTELFLKGGGTGTPTVVIDGKKAQSWMEDIPALLGK